MGEEGGSEMFVLALVRDGSLGWRVTLSDGSVRHYATVLAALLALDSETTALLLTGPWNGAHEVAPC